MIKEWLTSALNFFQKNFIVSFKLLLRFLVISSNYCLLFRKFVLTFCLLLRGRVLFENFTFLLMTIVNE